MANIEEIVNGMVACFNVNNANIELVNLNFNDRNYRVNLSLGDQNRTFFLRFNDNHVFKVYLASVNRDNNCLRATLHIRKENYNQVIATSIVSIYLSPPSEDNDCVGINDVVLRRINNTPDIQFFAEKWFSDNNNLEIDDGYREFWPKFDITKPPIERWKIDVDWQNNADNQDNSCWTKVFVVESVRQLLVRASYFKEYRYIGFPEYTDYRPTRPVDLKTDEVNIKLNDKGIRLPWHVLEAACSSLNAKKNVIFTGSPGCGKTTLAKVLAECAQVGEPIIVTASSCWTTNELIGRYLPSDSQNIRFSPGFFLQAIEDDKWLIIDELNRADIDACFGELFTVLSGQPAILPYEEVTEEAIDGVNNDNGQPRPIVVLPDDNQNYEEYRSYSIGSKFRMIGTMNDADASRLNQLSYAFQRRFNIIRVEAPSPNDMSDLIKIHINNKKNQIETSGTRRVYHKLLNIAANNAFQETLQSLFARDNCLICQKVVGVAQVIDIIDFVLEGLSAPSENNNAARLEFCPGQINKLKVSILKSYIALGVTMMVFPQLISLTGYNDSDKLESAINTVLNSFKNDNDEIGFYRIIAGRVENDNNINDFIRKELKLLFRNVTLNNGVMALIEMEAQNG